MVELDTELDLELAYFEAITRVRPYLFPAQAEPFFYLLDNPNSIISICTSRRASKSATGVFYQLDQALYHPHSKHLYLGLTQKALKKEIWRGMFLWINSKQRTNKSVPNKLPQLNLGGKVNQHSLTITFWNGSIIYLDGTESTEDIRERQRGNEWDSIVVDECQKYDIGQPDEHGEYPDDTLRELVEEILEPCTLKTNGSIILLGTPRAIPKGYWFKASTGKNPLIKHFNWHVSDNPHCKKEYEKKLIKAKMANPNIESYPWWRREWGGEWVQDATKQIYHYTDELNLCPPEEFNHTRHTRYILGLDIKGGNTSWGFVVLAYLRKGSHKVYVLETIKKPGNILVNEAAEIIRHLKEKYPILPVISDPANKAIIQELVYRENIPVSGAEKTDKRDFIDTYVNTDFTLGNIQILDIPETKPLREDFQILEWDEKGKEKGPTDVPDAFLYGYREAFHYRAKDMTKVPRHGTPEWYEMKDQQREEKLWKNLKQANKE